MRRVSFVLIGIASLAGCDDCNKKPDAQPVEAAAPEAASPADAGVHTQPTAAGDLPPWPGWPLPEGKLPNFQMYCEATFAIGLVDRHPSCSDAENDKMQAKHVTTRAKDRAKTCIHRLGSALEKGRASFDPNQAAQCIVEHIAALSRKDADGFHTTKACDATVEGHQKKGDPCGEPLDCEGHLTCVGYTETKDGKCEDPPPIGQPCGDAEHKEGSTLNIRVGDHPLCAEGAFCNEGKCEARAKEGAGCTRDSGCLEGLACIVGKCAKQFRVAAGGACQRDRDCQPRLDCLGAPEKPVANPDPKTLGKCTAEKPAGEACKDDSECKGACEGGKCVSLCGSG